MAAEPPPRPSRIDRKIPGDLDTIILKALENVPGRRYQSAADLAEDLGRFLKSEPILARRPTVPYLLRKKIYKYRHYLVAGLAATTLIVLGFWYTGRPDYNIAAARQSLSPGP